MRPAPARHGRATTLARVLGAGLAAVLLNAGSPAAQELEPRSYSPAPTGTTFIVVSATGSAGGVLTDPAAPLRDVDARLGICGLAVGRVFALMGKSVQLLGLVPLAWAEVRGAIGEDRREVSRRGLADPRIRFSMILMGARPAPKAQWVPGPRRAIIGWSLTAVPPVGQYDATRLVNLGSNRWSLKPEFGASLPAGRWTVDAYAGVWFFTDNDAYYPGARHRQQDPIVALQAHVSYTLKRRAWVAVSSTWYGGGQFMVDGIVGGDPYRNLRLGATLALPIGSWQSVKIAYSSGAATRVGADFKTITAAWQAVLY